MTDILTITPNPAVDLSTSVEKIIPTQKLRGTSQRRDPGGGGINVARVIKRLGGEARAIYPVGARATGTGWDQSPRGSRPLGRMGRVCCGVTVG